ncbi:MAG: hypothetical protein AAF500_12165 [Myxococcota bacterium]
MQQWEYESLVVDHGNRKYYFQGRKYGRKHYKNYRSVIAALGSHGWELTSQSTDGRVEEYAFKRPITGAPVAPLPQPRKARPKLALIVVLGIIAFFLWTAANGGN